MPLRRGSFGSNKRHGDNCRHEKQNKHIDVQQGKPRISSEIQRKQVYARRVSCCRNIERFCGDGVPAHQRPSVRCNGIWLVASFLQSSIQVQSQCPAVQWLTFPTWPSSLPSWARRTPLSRSDNTVITTAARPLPKYERGEWGSKDVWRERMTRRTCGCKNHLQNHPIHQCAAPQFWPFCCWSPERNELYACRRPPPLRLAQLLRYQPPAKSRRSPRLAIWSPQVTCSLGERDRHSLRRRYFGW